MIGLVVVGLDVLPEAMLIALQCMIGKQDKVVAVPLAPSEEADGQRQAILKAVELADDGDGVLVFVDSMASPAGYLMLSIMEQADVDVIGGVNLPMLCKVIELRHESSVEDLAKLARDEGRKAITWRTP
ncbi:MAG: PTS fructose transporter subunit IIA [Alphaproteobacteria bacterium]|nr:MAG: PTS fructose transporter subunit IIA [Alphaproteobacteria bacterium]